MKTRLRPGAVFCALGILLFWFAPALAAAPVAVCGLTGTAGQSRCIIPNADGSINTSAGGGGVGDVNITEVGGIPVGTTVPVNDDALLAAVQASVPAGANLIGKVGIDQTTPGSTNGVQLPASQVITTGTAGTASTQVVTIQGIAAATPVLTSDGGAVADAVAASGNPVPTGGIYESTLPTYTNAQRTTVHTGTRGSVHVELWGSDAGAPNGFVSNGVDGISNSQSGYLSITKGYAIPG